MHVQQMHEKTLEIQKQQYQINDATQPREFVSDGSLDIQQPVLMPN